MAKPDKSAKRWRLLAVGVGVAFLAVVGLNLARLGVIPFIEGDTGQEPQEQDEEPAAEEETPEPLAEEPEDWAQEAAAVADPVTIVFSAGSVVNLRGSVPEWGDRVRRERDLREILPVEFSIINSLQYHPQAPTYNSLDFRSIRIENDSLFTSGESEINQTVVLDVLGRFLLSEPDLVAEVIGHTDSVGDDESNRVLGLSRSVAVANYWLSIGVPSDQIVMWTAGERLPGTDDPNLDSRNRRVEIKFLPRNAAPPSS